MNKMKFLKCTSKRCFTPPPPQYNYLTQCKTKSYETTTNFRSSKKHDLIFQIGRCKFPGQLSAFDFRIAEKFGV